MNEYEVSSTRRSDGKKTAAGEAQRSTGKDNEHETGKSLEAT
jgi:hypothetical protein